MTSYEACMKRSWLERRRESRRWRSSNAPNLFCPRNLVSVHPEENEETSLYDSQESDDESHQMKSVVKDPAKKRKSPVPWDTDHESSPRGKKSKTDSSRSRDLNGDQEDQNYCSQSGSGRDKSSRGRVSDGRHHIRDLGMFRGGLGRTGVYRSCSTSDSCPAGASSHGSRCTADPGGRLNKKDGLTRYGDSHVKDKTS